MEENKIELEKYKYTDFIKKEARIEAAADYLKQFDPDDDVNVGAVMAILGLNKTKQQSI
nr:MAG TPA: hypothetical protein [Caudoviricetes sp.]